MITDTTDLTDIANLTSFPPTQLNTRFCLLWEDVNLLFAKSIAVQYGSCHCILTIFWLTWQLLSWTSGWWQDVSNMAGLPYFVKISFASDPGGGEKGHLCAISTHVKIKWGSRHFTRFHSYSPPKFACSLLATCKPRDGGDDFWRSLEWFLKCNFFRQLKSQISLRDCAFWRHVIAHLAGAMFWKNRIKIYSNFTGKTRDQLPCPQ